MSLTTPADVDAVITRAIADVEQALAALGGKPALKNSWLRALIVSYSHRVFDFYFALDQAALEALPDTAVDNLERWAAIWGIIRTAGTPATGTVVADGTFGSTIPLGTFLVDGAGLRYETTAAGSIEFFNFGPITAGNLTSDGSGTATLITDEPHGLAGSSIGITVVGATQSDYNVANSPFTVVNATTITYAITGTPASPATGTITLLFESGPLPVKSVEAGSDQDQVFDVALKFESPIAGVDNVANVEFDELGGGADRETTTALRARLLDRIQNPVAHFSAAEIIATAKTVAGVTRVFVQEITPNVGQVTVYFMRDNDITSIPSGSEVAVVKAVLDAIRPATSDTDDLIVLAPTGISTAFTFSAISPDTASMKTAIEANLAELFDERTEIGVDVTEDAYRSAIFGTVDTTTGQGLASFTLSAPPTGPIVIASGEIATLGAVIFT